MNSVNRGTYLLSITMTLSKILGLIYIIPFTLLVGTSGYILYEYAYKPYAIMLSLATMGVPAAVSKFVAKYNELGDYETSRRLLKSGIWVMLLTGLIWFATMQISAEKIALFLLGGEFSEGSSVSDVVFVIRMVSFALLIVPVMALLRGYFQGNQKMAPTGISQVVEQFVRIVVILLSAYLILKKGMFGGELVNAIGVATFAATVAAFVSLLNLIYYFYKYREMFKVQKEKAQESRNSHEKISLFRIYKEIVFYAVPFIFVSLAIPIYQNIDIATINRGLTSAGNSLKEAEYINSIIAITGKLVTIPIVVANAFGLTLVPAITKAFVGKDDATLKELVTKTIQVILFITLPFAAAFYVLSEEFYVTTFGTSDYLVGGQMVQAFALISLFYCMFVVTSAMLQGINKQYTTVVSLSIGLLIKVLVAVPFIEYFGGAGSSYSTMLCFVVSIGINLVVIFKTTKVNLLSLLMPTLKVIQYSIIALLVMLSAEWLLQYFGLFNGLGYKDYLFRLLGIGILGAAAFVVPSYLTGDLMKMLKK